MRFQACDHSIFGTKKAYSFFVEQREMSATEKIPTMHNRRETMDVKDFCQAIESEMMAWKAKLYGAMRRIDKLGTRSGRSISEPRSILWMIGKEAP
jgi:hypothetical protein